MKKSLGFGQGKLCVLMLLVIFGAARGAAQTAPAAELKFNLIATDKNGNFVTGLAREDVAVSVDGQEQANFTLETESVPLVYMLAIDNSGSMRLLLEEIRAAARKIIEKNGGAEAGSLLRFVDAEKIQPAEKFSSDRDYLFRILDNYHIEGGQTALIDAVYKSVELTAAHQTAARVRRTVVVISDGEDRQSRRTRAQLVELLKKEQVQVFFIGLVNELVKSKRKEAVELIETLARESGGAAIYPEKDQKISFIADQLAAQMQTQLVVKIPAGAGGGKIEVKPSKRAEKRDLKFYYRAAPAK